MTSLRVGYQLPVDVIVAQAYSLGPVQLLVTEYGQRGYIRRADLDVAAYSPTQTTLSLAYQKPGISTDLEMPTIAITSKVVLLGGVSVIVSTYDAWCSRDSLGVRTIWCENTPDAPMSVGEVAASAVVNGQGVFGAEAPYKAYYVDGPAIAREIGSWAERLDKTWKATCRFRQTAARAGAAAGLAAYATTPAGMATGPARIAAAAVVVDVVISESMPCQ
ncbi:MAG: hypothetical protein ABL977_05635 [Candidatus Eisenbacteria bacterium]